MFCTHSGTQYPVTLINTLQLVMIYMVIIKYLCVIKIEWEQIIWLLDLIEFPQKSLYIRKHPLVWFQPFKIPLWVPLWLCVALDYFLFTSAFANVSLLMPNTEAIFFVWKCTEHQLKCCYWLMLMNIVSQMLSCLLLVSASAYVNPDIIWDVVISTNFTFCHCTAFVDSSEEDIYKLHNSCTLLLVYDNALVIAPYPVIE